MKRLILLVTTLTFTTTLIGQQNNNPIDYTMLGTTTERFSQFSLILDIPVFSGVFGAQYYGISAGVVANCTYKSKFRLDFDAHYNLTGEELVKGDYLTNLRANSGNFADARFQFDFVGAFKLFSNIRIPEEPTRINLSTSSNRSYYFNSSEIPLLKNYNLRVGYGRIGGPMVLESAFELPVSTDESFYYAYSSTNKYAADFISNDSNIETAVTTNVIRLGFERTKISYFEFNVNNWEDYSFLKKSGGKKRFAYERGIYADVLVNIGNSDPTNTVKLIRYEIDNESYEVLTEEDYFYDFNEQLTNSPIGIALGIKSAKYKKKGNSTIYLEIGVRPGLGMDITNRIYGKWGFAIGFGSFKND